MDSDNLIILSALSNELKIHPDSIVKVANSANYLYRKFEIPKKNKKGNRVIHQPTSELKTIQRALNRILFNKFQIHNCAFAYIKKRGSNILKNANQHKHSKYLLRIDFKNFFESITDTHIVNLLKSHKSNSYSEADLNLVKKITCRNKKLTIGAPSSPVVSNVILYDFDQRIAEMCKNKDIIYSRYADDLFFSTQKKDQLTLIEREVKKALSDCQLDEIKINQDKVSNFSKKHKRVITGLIITSDHKISIGRKKKLETKARIHNFLKGGFSKEDIKKLQGYISFVKSVEPTFYKALERKYGKSNFDTLIESNEVNVL